MKTVYIASPYTIGDKEENVARQIDAAEELANLGYLPIWPLSSHYWHLVHPHGWQFWMAMDFELVRRCDILLRLPGESEGADAEVFLAQSLDKPVYYSVSAVAKG